MKKIIKRYTAPVSISEAWHYWTTHDGLQQFFGVDNTMELCLNGPFEIYFSMDAPKGERGSEGCRVLSFEDEKMFSFSWNAPPSIPKARNSGKETFVILFFTELDAQQTRLDLIHSGWVHQGEEWDACYAYFDHAWEIVFQWLDAAIKNKQ